MVVRRDHRSVYERRNQLARERGFRNYYEVRKLGGAHGVTRQSAPVLASLSERARETRRSALEAVSIMRHERIPLARAARRAGVEPSTVRFWAGKAFGPTGSVNPADRLLRELLIVSDGRTMQVDVRGSRQAAVVAAYWNAVSRFLETGDTRLLTKFEGKTVAGHVLETDLDVLEDLALSGGLQFEDIYALAG